MRFVHTIKPVALSTDPSASVSGEFYYNTASSHWRGYNGASWVDINPKYYGSWYSASTQTNPVADVARGITFNSTDIEYGIRITSGSVINFDHSGVYDIQFSSQLDKNDSGQDDVDIWLYKNGQNVAWSNTRVALPKNNAKVVAAWNWFVSVSSGDEVSIMWSSADTSVFLHAEPEQSNPNRPGIPSVILTINEI